MTTFKTSTTRPERGSWRMGAGAVLFMIGANGLTSWTLLPLVLMLIAVALFVWGYRRAFVGPSLPRVADVLERAAEGLRG